MTATTPSDRTMTVQNSPQQRKVAGPMPAPAKAHSPAPSPIAPDLEYAFTISIDLTGLRYVEPSATGMRRGAIYAASGTVKGPLLNGRVVPMSGGDYPLVRADGVIDFDARYLLEADDGAIIYMQNRGYRWPRNAEAAELLANNLPAAMSGYYMRTSPRFDAPAGPHEWMGMHVFVGIAEKVPGGNSIHYYVVR